MTRPATVLIDRIDDVAGRYDAMLVDIWGVLHNGVAAFRDAVAALVRLRQAGKHVMLLSNAPRPHGAVVPQLDAVGVKREAYDAFLTSGDMARRFIEDRPGEPLFHIGAERHLSLFEGLDAPHVAIEHARYAVCTNLRDDETETVADYAAELIAMRARGLTLLCANPDLVVDRGGRLIPCAGAIAQAYDTLGGTTIMVGKPHPPIYAEALGRLPSSARVLAIGDSLRTDIAGAAGAGIDSLFVAHGIHATHWADGLVRWFDAQIDRPTYAVERLI